MSPRTGRPVVGKPKEITIRALIDEDENTVLEECSARMNATKSDVIRKGIRLVKKDLDTKK